MKLEEDLTILKELKGRFGDEILNNYPFPSAYKPDIKNPKSILLGCDPSNRHSNTLKYVFAIESHKNIFNSSIERIKSQLNQIGLNLDNVYCQNLCKNYFQKETAKNKIWYQVAEYWIPYLKIELSRFHTDIPVLLTSECLYKALRFNNSIYYKPIEFYECKTSIPIPPDENKLNRPLIPFYRHYKYSLGNYETYREKARKIVNNIN
jgi:hypothetical protein